MDKPGGDDIRAPDNANKAYPSMKTTMTAASTIEAIMFILRRSTNYPDASGWRASTSPPCARLSSG
jgi:hypothetical protein